MKKYIFLAIASFFINFLTITAQSNQTGNCEGAFNTLVLDQLDSIAAFYPPNPTDPPPPPPGPTGTDRVVYWIHGLAGSPGAWEKAAVATSSATSGVPDYPSRKVQSFRPTYSEDGDLNDGAWDLSDGANGILSFDNQLSTVQKENPLNFVISHSQGGLVSRKVDQLYANGQLELFKQRFHGIVTFGTPHAGALIANNAINGKGTEWAESLCTDLGQGPGTSLAIPLENLLIYVPVLCNIVSSQLDGFLGNEILKDYRVGVPGNGIVELNNGPSLTPYRVAFYGEEDEEVCWREIFHLGSVPGFGNSASSYPVFGANDDDKAMKNVKILKTFYRVMQYGNALKFPTIATIARYFAWKRGADALVNANDGWKQLIGATRTQIVPTGSFCQCTTEEDDFIDGMTLGQMQHLNLFQGAEPSYYSYNTNDPACGGNPDCQFVVTYSSVQIDEKSDGVVPVSSQTAFPGVNAVAKMDGSNHQSMRNDTNTKDRLNELWGGTHGLFFVTEPR